MPAPLDHFTDEELLAFCALADAIHAYGAAMTEVERAFLKVMREKELWSPPSKGA